MYTFGRWFDPALFRLPDDRNRFIIGPAMTSSLSWRSWKDLIITKDHQEPGNCPACRPHHRCPIVQRVSNDWKGRPMVSSCAGRLPARSARNVPPSGNPRTGGCTALLPLRDRERRDYYREGLSIEKEEQHSRAHNITRVQFCARDRWIPRRVVAASRSSYMSYCVYRRT